MNASTSRSQSSTPIKAITSTLTARSAPSIPPASQLYEPLAKAVLRRRLVYNVFFSSAVATWILVSCWYGWQKGGIDNVGLVKWVAGWVAPSNLVFTALVWTAAAIPVAVLRRVYITATPATSLSPQQTFRLLFAQPKSRRAFVVLSISSVICTALHTFMSYFVESTWRGDPRLGLWSRSKKHPYHINGRFIYLLLTQLAIASSYWVRDLLRDRFSIKWSRRIDNKISFMTVMPNLIPSILSMAVLSTISTAFATLSFAVLRMIVFPIVYRLPVVHGFLRPLTAHFLRPKYTFTFLWTHSDLILRAYFLSVTISLIWDLTSTLFDICSSVPVNVIDGAKDHALILVSGVHSTDSYIQHHAFHELALLASNPGAASKRAAIYSDTKYSPSIWAAFVRQSLLQLGRDYQLLLRRGAPPPTPVVAAPAPTSKELDKPSTPILHKPVFKSARSSPLATVADSLASDSALTQALTQSADEVAGVPELFRSVKAALPSPRSIFSQSVVSTPSKQIAGASSVTETVEKKTTVVEGAKTVAAEIQASTGDWKVRAKDVWDMSRYVWRGTWWTGSALSAWWVRERKNKTAIKCVPNKELDVMIVEALTNLIARSLSEDTLGVVQRDIPRVIEALLAFLVALEDYQAELSALHPPLPAEQQVQLSVEALMLREHTRMEVALGSEWIGGLTEALQTGVGLLVRTFGERLSAFKFPPRTAKKLQGFVDYSL